jgi:hypothetical protein
MSIRAHNAQYLGTYRWCDDTKISTIPPPPIEIKYYKANKYLCQSARNIIRDFGLHTDTTRIVTCGRIFKLRELQCVH